MNIYLVRHGDAERANPAKKDFDRALTNEGRTRTEKAAEGWKIFIPQIDYIVSSPLVRALQTAKIIAEAYNKNNDIIIDNNLMPGSKTETIIEIANSLEGKDIVFVGHQPDFSYHVSNLISNNHAQVEFKKSAIAKITFNSRVHFSKGVLEFLIPSKCFR